MAAPRLRENKEDVVQSKNDRFNDINSFFQCKNLLFTPLVRIVCDYEYSVEQRMNYMRSIYKDPKNHKNPPKLEEFVDACFFELKQAEHTGIAFLFKEKEFKVQQEEFLTALFWAKDSHKQPIPRYQALAAYFIPSHEWQFIHLKLVPWLKDTYLSSKKAQNELPPALIHALRVKLSIVLKNPHETTTLINQSCLHLNLESEQMHQIVLEMLNLNSIVNFNGTTIDKKNVIQLMRNKLRRDERDAQSDRGTDNYKRYFSY